MTDEKRQPPRDDRKAPTERPPEGKASEATVAEAIDRATAAVGQDDGKR